MRLLKKLLLVLTPMGAAAFVAGGGTFGSFRDLARWTPRPKKDEAPDPLWKTKKLLLGVMLIGVAAYLGLGGTFANFQAETSNNGSSITSGTLTMSNTVNSNTACFSYNALSADNVNAGCDAPFAITNVAPGTFQSTQIAKIVVANSGSINGSSLYLYASQVSGKLTSALNSGTSYGTLTVGGGMEGTVSNLDNITVSYNGKSQVFIVSGTPTPASNSNGGATSIPVTAQVANFNYPAGAATVTDTSGNTLATNTDCFDTKTATAAAYNYNSITASTTQQAFNPFCGAVVMWVQELTGGKTYCWAGKGSTYSAGSSPALTEDANGRCTAPIYSTTTGLSGTNQITIPISGTLNGNVSSGDSITVTQGATTQTFTASAAAPIGSTSISINSATVTTAFTSGAVVTDPTAQGALDSNYYTTDSLTNFDTGHHQSSGKIELLPIASNGVLDSSANHASELAAGGSRTFYVGLYLPKPSGSNQNGIQGIASTFGLTWHMDQ